MSGTFPSSPEANTAQKRSLRQTLVSISHSLKRQTRTRGAQRWGFSLSWEILTRAQISPIDAFVESQRGQLGAFQIVIPGFSTSQGSWAGSPLVDGASQTGNTLNVKGLTAGQTGIVKAGDMFSVSGHAKVYMAVADANSTAGGLAAISIEPKLITSPADNEALTTTAVPFTCALAGDLAEVPVRSPSLYSYSLEIIEDA